MKLCHPPRHSHLRRQRRAREQEEKGKEINEMEQTRDRRDGVPARVREKFRIGRHAFIADLIGVHQFRFRNEIRRIHGAFQACAATGRFSRRKQ